MIFHSIRIKCDKDTTFDALNILPSTFIEGPSLLHISESVRYDALCRLIQSQRHSALSTRLILNFVAASYGEPNFRVDEVDTIVRGEVAKMRETFAPFLATGIFSILAAIGSRASVEISA
ncbi:hypothetical protein BDN71DRAFT_864624 [Pleurotus eryngii]|uniref:Uncharacterized protein n=1 Tax=Pleurotus eryngii TaxID=5323 RepID=A0A9P6DFL1_PLEER|nr:hypothetical protein BDN71DRAFT_864624 [Pleurotus eryngii]